MWSSHRMEYYSALKRKDVLTRAETRTNLEDVVFSNIRQTQKDKHCVHLHAVPGRVRQAESRRVRAGARGGGESE